MKPIQKAATAAIALTITLTGAVLTTAPMTLAGSRLVASYTGARTPSRAQLTLPGQAGPRNVARSGTDLTHS